MLRCILLSFLSSLLGALLVRRVVVKIILQLDYETNVNNQNKSEIIEDREKIHILAYLKKQILLLATITGAQMGIACISSYYKSTFGLVLGTICCILYLKNLYIYLKIYNENIF